MKINYDLLATARIHLAIAFACFMTGVTMFNAPEKISMIPYGAWAFGYLLVGVFLAQLGIAEYRGHKAGMKNDRK